MADLVCEPMLLVTVELSGGSTLFWAVETILLVAVELDFREKSERA